MKFGKSEWRTFEQGMQKEWLLTNGIGGFASSTVIGANTRRYHGLLIASLDPPVKRHLILSSIHESIITGEITCNLSSFKTPDYTMRGFEHLCTVSVDPLPVFVYQVGEVFLEKKVCLVYRENTVAVLYHVISGPKSVKLRLTPLVNFRNYHHNACRKYMNFTSAPYESGVMVKPYNLPININIFCSQGEFVPQSDNWFYNMYYPIEMERGLHAVEDHYIPGFFDITVESWQDRYITLIATIEDEIKETDGLLLIKKEESRIMELKSKAGLRDEFAGRLVVAADNFIAYRASTKAMTILAGYPWFTDWGRDAMIAYTGIVLCTKRYEDARQVLLCFSRHAKYGLIPNLFPDDDGNPGYNSVDAALWFIEAVNKYIKYTKDYDFVKQNLYGTIKQIMKSYIEGTLFNIKMDEDCLISAGSADMQLTWMDAKVEGIPVTPRQKKAVEINALWYNSLRIASVLAGLFGEEGASRYYTDIASKAARSFERVFWNVEKLCLYDVVDGEFKDDSIRPNQVLAISLSHSVLTGEKARMVLEKVWDCLYTPYGLRSLSKDSDKYIGIYKGTQAERDRTYHQGTVWVWLLGQFITAFMKVYGYTEENRKRVRLFLEPFREHLRDACIGNISEIFDGNIPFIPRGCFAQAWSVGEILRVYVEECQA